MLITLYKDDTVLNYTKNMDKVLKDISSTFNTNIDELYSPSFGLLTHNFSSLINYQFNNLLSLTKDFKPISEYIQRLNELCFYERQVPCNTKYRHRRDLALCKAALPDQFQINPSKENPKIFQINNQKFEEFIKSKDEITKQIDLICMKQLIG